MAAPLARFLPPRGIAIAVVAITFFSLLISAGLRATPGVLMVPLELHFGWSRASISAAAAIGILLYGLIGPFAAAFMQSFGIRRTMIGGLALMSARPSRACGCANPGIIWSPGEFSPASAAARSRWCSARRS